MPKWDKTNSTLIMWCYIPNEGRHDTDVCHCRADVVLVKSMNSRWPNKFSLSRSLSSFTSSSSTWLNLAEVIAMTTLCFTNWCGRLEVPFTQLLCWCLRVHKCVLYNYVHVFALFRGSLCLFSLCVSGVVLASPRWFLLTQRHIKGSGPVFLWLIGCVFPRPLTVSPV